MKRVSFFTACILWTSMLWAVSWSVGGCRPTTQTEKPAPTANELWAELSTQHNVIRDAYEQDNPEAAHEALHDVAGLLDALGALPAESGLSLTQREQIKAAAATMSTAYMQLDEAAHEGKSADYSAVAEDLSGALETMQQALKE